MPTRPDREELAARLRSDPDDKLLADLHRADLTEADLTEANLTGANLTEADLTEADLTQADLTKADLTEADLTGANLTGAGLTGAGLAGADLTGADLTGANLPRANLTGADLSGANLTGADLTGADLTGADLSGANLIGANLSGADLTEADLTGANLTEADLTEANLTKADLTEANLTGADLAGADVTRADLTCARLTEARLIEANFTRADLTCARLTRADLTCARLTEAHFSSVTLPGSVRQAELLGIYVDWKTVALSLRMPDLQAILVRTGMPEVTAIYLIDSARSIDEGDLFTMLQSVFLSYGRPDAEFAKKLRNDLTRNGVKTWFFPKDAVPGARLQRHLQTQINSYDRLILCCSEASLQRTGVLHEVEEVLEREQDEGGAEILIPIMLDPIFDTGKTPPPWWPEGKEHIYLSLRRRVAADFRGVMDDPDRWSEQLGRVVAALRKRPEQAEPG